MKLILLLAAIATVVAATSAYAQTSASGQAVVVATPTPGPVGTASTALNSSLTGGGITNGQGSMGGAVAITPVSAAPATVPGAITINSNASSVGSGNVAGSVQINNGGAGSVTGAPTSISPVPTYVTPGTGLGTAVTTTVNPNPGSVQ